MGLRNFGVYLRKMRACWCVVVAVELVLGES